MRKLVLVLSLVVITAMVSACGNSRYLRAVAADSNSLLFGYLDMDDAPSDLDEVVIRQVVPVDRPDWGMRTADGMFYVENLPPGSYEVARFGGCSGLSFSSIGVCIGGRTIYLANNLHRPGAKEAVLRVEKPAIYFLGAYKYQEVEPEGMLERLFAPEKFTFTPVDSPTEEELLGRLLKYAQGTPWEGKIQARLRALRTRGR